jgi:hypothetical protein
MRVITLGILLYDSMLELKQARLAGSAAVAQKTTMYYLMGLTA